MHPMEPVDLRGDSVILEPLSIKHAAGLLAAADAEEVFAWLPYARPTDLTEHEAGLAAPLPIGARIDGFRLPPLTPRTAQ